MYVVDKIVEYSECDYTGCMSFIRFCELSENMVSMALKELGSDNYTLKEKYDAMWVFSKNKVNVIRFPHWSEDIHVTCQCVKTMGIRCHMETIVYDKEGNICLTSIIEGVVIDRKTNRIKKFTQVNFNPILAIEKDIVFDTMKCDEIHLIKEVKVTPDLLDFCLHVNNVEYLRLIVSTFELKEILQYKYDIVEVRYLSQSLATDTLQIYSDDAKRFFVIRKGEKEVLRVKFI